MFAPVVGCGNKGVTGTLTEEVLEKLKDAYLDMVRNIEEEIKER